MRKIYTLKVLLCTLLLIASIPPVLAQCPAGSTTATVNWDNLDYLNQNGTYAAFVTNAMMRTQRFVIGHKRQFTLDFPATMTTNGENTTNTAEAGSYGTGADVEYNGNGSIVIVFDSVVRNVTFSLYDIDLQQSVRVTAADGAGTPVALNITMTALSAGVITVAGNGTTTPTATTTNTTLGNADTRGTLNISVAGNSPAAANGVKTITIIMGFGGGTAGNFWLSDINACIVGAFPIDYYKVDQEPWIGQPAYYMVTPDNNGVYMMNPLTGVAEWLFSEPVSPWVNSMAYDHVNKILYYVMDNPSPISTNRSLKKYDFNTETVSTVIADVRTLGIPLYEIVVESAGAAFYDGSLFLGIEGTNNAKNSARESIIWRIDFNAANVPYRASQVMARPADNGSGLLTHDWGDFTIKDGTLFNFNTGNSGSTSQFTHFNMQTGNITIYNTNGNPAPIQAGQTYDGKIYWTGGQSPELGRVALYNENGTIGPKIVATVSVCSPPWVGRAGDASDPFKPKSDFGDAPVSYDPIHMDKATHEYDCNLRLGATYDREWDKTSSAGASADGADEDGIGTVTILTPGTNNFVQDIEVYNNTTATATLAAWLDYNANGTFDVGEGRTMNVPPSGAMQTITLSWMGIFTPLPIGSTTYLRVRLTTSAPMTVGDATGWYKNGEVEDYPVIVQFLLPVRLLSFNAKAEGNDIVVLDWKTVDEYNFDGFAIERSIDGASFQQIGFVKGKSNGGITNNYSFDDINPIDGKAFYRLKLVSIDGSYKYSEVRIVTLKTKGAWIKIKPNPVYDHAVLQYNLMQNENVRVQVIDASGRIVSTMNVPSLKGLNQLDMNEWSKLSKGTYIVQVQTSQEVLSTKVFVQ